MLFAVSTYANNSVCVLKYRICPMSRKPCVFTYRVYQKKRKRNNSRHQLSVEFEYRRQS